MAAVQSLLPWGNTRPRQDHGSITEPFKCQVLHGKGNARTTFFPSQNMQTVTHLLPLLCCSRYSATPESHWSSPKQHNCSVKHSTPNKRLHLSKRH